MQGKYTLEPKSSDAISLADEMNFADDMNKASTVTLGNLWNI